MTAERRAVAGSGQRAGVAVREDAAARGKVGEQIGAVAADCGAEGDVFGVDRAGFGEQQLGEVRRRQRSSARVHRLPRTVTAVGDCRSSRSAQNRLTAVGTAGARRRSHCHSRRGRLLRQGTRRTPRRRRWRGAAHREPLDRLPHVLDRAALELDDFARQPRLVEQHEMAVDAALPAQRRRSAGGARSRSCRKPLAAAAGRTSRRPPGWSPRRRDVDRPGRSAAGRGPPARCRAWPARSPTAASRCTGRTCWCGRRRRACW